MSVISTFVTRAIQMAVVMMSRKAFARESGLAEVAAHSAVVIAAFFRSKQMFPNLKLAAPALTLQAPVSFHPGS